MPGAAPAAKPAKKPSAPAPTDAPKSRLVSLTVARVAGGGVRLGIAKREADEAPKAKAGGGAAVAKATAAPPPAAASAREGRTTEAASPPYLSTELNAATQHCLAHAKAGLVEQRLLYGSRRAPWHAMIATPAH